MLLLPVVVAVVVVGLCVALIAIKRRRQCQQRRVAAK